MPAEPCSPTALEQAPADGEEDTPMNEAVIRAWASRVVSGVRPSGHSARRSEAKALAKEVKLLGQLTHCPHIAEV